MPLLIVGIIGLGVAGFAVDKAGEGLNDASNAIVKVVVVGGIAYIAAKKLKVI